jgi:hypothetical protein
VRNLRENLGWAFGYNALLIPLAAGVFEPVWGLGLTPEFSGLAMAFSSVSVLLNALRLRRFRAVFPEDGRTAEDKNGSPQTDGEAIKRGDERVQSS